MTQETSEAVLEPKQEMQPKAEQTAQEEIQPDDLLAAQIHSKNPLANNNPPTDSQNSNPYRPLLFLAAIFGLALLAGLGLVFFRRKN